MLRTLTAALMLALAAAPSVAVPRQQDQAVDEVDPAVSLQSTLQPHVELPSPAPPKPRRAVRPNGHHRHRPNRRPPVPVPLRVAGMDSMGPSSEARVDVPTGSSGDPVERWRPLVEFDSPTGTPRRWDPNRALRAIRCESGGRADATENPPYVGLLQIENGPLDPEANLDWAEEMVARFGWSRWPVCGRR